MTAARRVFTWMMAMILFATPGVEGSRWPSRLSSWIERCTALLFPAADTTEPHQTRSIVAADEYVPSMIKRSSDFLILLPPDPRLLEKTLEKMIDTWIRECAMDQHRDSTPSPHLIAEEAYKQALQAITHHPSKPVRLVSIPIEDWSQSAVFLTAARDYFLISLHAPELRPTERQYLAEEISRAIPAGALMIPAGRALAIQLGQSHPDLSPQKVWRFAEHLREMLELEGGMRFAPGSFDQLEKKLIRDVLMLIYTQSVLQMEQPLPPQLHACLMQKPPSEVQTRKQLLKAIRECLAVSRSSIPHSTLKERLIKRWNHLSDVKGPLTFSYTEDAFVESPARKKFRLGLVARYDFRLDRSGGLQLLSIINKVSKSNLLLTFNAALIFQNLSFAEILSQLPSQAELDFFVEKSKAAAEHWIFESRL